MTVKEPNNLPFVSEYMTNGIEDIRRFLHKNIYSRQEYIDILIQIINDQLDPFFSNYVYDLSSSRPTINIKLKKTNIKKILDCDQNDNYIKYCTMISNYIFIEFFNHPKIKKEIEKCGNAMRMSLNDINFINLIFSLNILADNWIIIYL